MTSRQNDNVRKRDRDRYRRNKINILEKMKIFYIKNKIRIRKRRKELYLKNRNNILLIEKDRYKKNRNHICMLRKKRRAFYKGIIYQLKTKCSICGETNVDKLLFHHKDKNSKCFELSQITFSIKKMLDEAMKCKILCFKCHSRLHKSKAMKGKQ